ncbi:DNA alkylation repair protein [Isorropodon fossajaponicum endosymbiont JTNG4]|uniref:DNA alkylation repair protein n=1 Tax=Isorropodon fossajaponicum symbiont TaxID=883811 RepID=UPI001916A9A9|nr:DNA alkylation repair protein [Isorropodon fossajaponicum symbiont]BBB23891.1 DNA alkylation repair protein [Isorropodon fossajaponicum endosymbiont JTNG4]
MSSDKIISQLKSFATEQRRQTNEWFFKTGKGEYSEFDQFMGVRMPQIRQVAKQYFEGIAYAEIDKLIHHPIHEIRHCGLIILVNKYQSDDETSVFKYYLKNINSVNNWDLVDTTTPHIVGDYIYHHQDQLPLLFEFSKSNDLWEKRIAIVATFAFIKQGEFEPTFKIAKALLADTHDLIHKAIGWMLRGVYKKDHQATQLFLQENYKQLPRTTLRYAIERMTDNQRLLYFKGKF